MKCDWCKTESNHLQEFIWRLTNKHLLVCERCYQAELLGRKIAYKIQKFFLKVINQIKKQL